MKTIVQYSEAIWREHEQYAAAIDERQESTRMKNFSLSCIYASWVYSVKKERGTVKYNLKRFWSKISLEKRTSSLLKCFKTLLFLEIFLSSLFRIIDFARQPWFLLPPSINSKCSKAALYTPVESCSSYSLGRVFCSPGERTSLRRRTDPGPNWPWRDGSAVQISWIYMYCTLTVPFKKTL